MSSLSEVSPEAKNDSRTETPSRFKRKFLTTNRVPRRYIMTLFLFVLQFLHHWMSANVLYVLTASSFVSYEDEDISEEQLSASANWTAQELDYYLKGSMTTDIVLQIPGALIIFAFSSHKYLLVSTILISILHMLTPTAISHHSSLFVVVLFLQYAISSPIDVAVLSIWKSWAPSFERSRLIVFSFAGAFLMIMSFDYYVHFIVYNLSEEHFYYAGLSCLIWSAFWYNLTSDSPQSDPLISEQELVYLEATIPSDVQQKIKIADVPWKSIITSKQVLILCLIFFKTSCSVSAIIMSGEFLSLSDFPTHINIEIGFVFVFLIIIPVSAIIADVLIKKFSGRTLLIRKCFLCGGFVLQNVFILGSFTSSHYAKTLCYFLAYTFFAASLPGFFTIPLDLSPKYVTIIGGLIFTFYFVADLLFDIVTDSIMTLKGPYVYSWILLIDAVMSSVCAVLFGIWGDVEEQLWSLNSSARSRPDCYRSYPRPEDQDDVTLVSENCDGEFCRISND